MNTADADWDSLMRAMALHEKGDAAAQSGASATHPGPLRLRRRLRLP
jgi:hypothetical protein